MTTIEEGIKVYDLYKDGKGIFYYINEIEPLPFLNLIDVQTMDLTFITFYGNRQVSKPIQNIVGEDITQEGLKQVATMIYGLYFNKWTNLYNIYREEIDLDTYVSKTTETIIDDGETNSEFNQNRNNTNTEGVAGYNTDDMTDARQTIQEDSNETSNKETKNNRQEREKETRGSLGNRIDDRNKAVETLKNEVLYGMIYKDVAQLIALQIF